MIRLIGVYGMYTKYFEKIEENSVETQLKQFC